MSETFDNFRQESRDNITSEKGIWLRINRSIQAEGVFGITKQDYGFKRFLMRGTENVRTEYLLLAIAFNLKQDPQPNTKRTYRASIVSASPISLEKQKTFRNYPESALACLETEFSTKSGF